MCDAKREGGLGALQTFDADFFVCTFVFFFSFLLMKWSLCSSISKSRGVPASTEACFLHFPNLHFVHLFAPLHRAAFFRF